MENYKHSKDGLINKCPSCGRFKDEIYDVCLDCYSRPPRRQTRANTVTVRETKRRCRPERSRVWDKKYSDAARFFVYILKLEGRE